VPDDFSGWGGAAREFAARKARGCSEKDRYPTVSDAMRAKSRKERDYKKRLSVYRCGFCRGFHHTSARPRK